MCGILDHQFVAQSHDIEGERRENRCQLSTHNTGPVKLTVNVYPAKLFSKTIREKANMFSDRLNAILSVFICFRFSKNYY